MPNIDYKSVSYTVKNRITVTMCLIWLAMLTHGLPPAYGGNLSFDYRERLGGKLLQVLSCDYDYVTKSLSLIEQGADVSLIAGHRHETALGIAAARGGVKLIEPLLNAGAKINAANTFGMIPLHAAVWNGHKNIVQILLARGADVHVQTSNNETPLDIAESRGLKDIEQLLRDAGASE